MHAGHWWVGLVLYGLGTVGFSGANVFYDSMLVDVAEPHELDLVSALGYSAGYIGGGLLFLVNVMMAQKPEWFGLAGPGEAVKASFLSVSVWWALFTVPLLRWVTESPDPRASELAFEAVRQGLRQLAETLKEIRSFKVLLLFLIAYWVYIDGVNTVIKTAVFFGDRILGLDQGALITALLLTQFVAFPAALAFGALGQRIGPKPAILIGIAVYLAALVYAWRFPHQMNATSTPWPSPSASCRAECKASPGPSTRASCHPRRPPSSSASSTWSASSRRSSARF